MRIGVPKEIKTHEYRVGLVPSSVRELEGCQGCAYRTIDGEARQNPARLLLESNSLLGCSNLLPFGLRLS